MSVKLVFNNATNVPMRVSIVTSGVIWASGNEAFWKNVSGRQTASGAVSGRRGYVVGASQAISGTKLVTNKFSGDTEVTLAVFTMPINPID